jgi:hypothetical protein
MIPSEIFRRTAEIAFSRLVHFGILS